MLARTPEPCNCGCTPDWANKSADRVRPLYAEAALRVYTLLEVADILTEKATLSEQELNALEVVLTAAREHAREILLSCEQLPDNGADADAW